MITATTIINLGKNQLISSWIFYFIIERSQEKNSRHVSGSKKWCREHGKAPFPLRAQLLLLYIPSLTTLWGHCPQWPRPCLIKEQNTQLTNLIKAVLQLRLPLPRWLCFSLPSLQTINQCNVQINKFVDSFKMNFNPQINIKPSMIAHSFNIRTRKVEMSVGKSWIAYRGPGHIEPKFMTSP